MNIYSSYRQTYPVRIEDNSSTLLNPPEQLGKGEEEEEEEQVDVPFLPRVNLAKAL